MSTTADDAFVAIDAGLDGIGIAVPWFRSLLNEVSIRLHPASALARALDQLEEFAERARNGDLVLRFDNAHEPVTMIENVFGSDFVTKMLRRAVERGLTGYEDRLRDLVSGDPLPIGKGDQSTARNRTWELMLACAAATFATDVRFEEPDVTFNFQGRRLGLAAKVMQSMKGARHIERIVEGARQLERADVEGGQVVLSFADIYPAVPLYASMYRNESITPRGITEVIDGWAAAFMVGYAFDELVKKLRGNRKLLDISFFIPAAVPMARAPMLACRMSCINIEGREEQAHDLRHALHDAFQNVLSYRSIR